MHRNDSSCKLNCLLDGLHNRNFAYLYLEGHKGFCGRGETVRNRWLQTGAVISSDTLMVVPCALPGAITHTLGRKNYLEQFDTTTSNIVNAILSSLVNKS